MQPQTKTTQPPPTPYERLEDLPEGITGEILDGQLRTQPRPSGPHGFVESVLGGELFGPFHKGSGGPGGWWIIIEPEIHFMHDVEVTVPDLADRRRRHMPAIPTGHRYKVVPDWICEILSPSTESKDRRIKMPLYARYGVPYAWLIDPAEHRLEAYRLDAGAWLEIGHFTGADQVSVPPFEAVSIDFYGHRLGPDSLSTLDPGLNLFRTISYSVCQDLRVPYPLRRKTRSRVCARHKNLTPRLHDCSGS